MNKNGFTLIEILIAIFMFGIVAITFTAIFQSSSKSYYINSSFVGLRQNLRTSIDFLTGDLSRAGFKGYNMTDWTFASSDAGFLQAGSNVIQYTMDLNSNGVIDIGEDITISLEAGADFDNDGIVDSSTGTAALERTVAGLATQQVIMENIEGIGFAYAYDTDDDNELDFNDANGNGTPDIGENTIWAYDSDSDESLDMQIDPTGINPEKSLTVPIPIENIRAVRLWILARASRSKKWTKDTNTYFLGKETVTPAGDNFKRELVSATILCRNMLTR